MRSSPCLTPFERCFEVNALDLQSDRACSVSRELSRGNCRRAGIARPFRVNTMECSSAATTTEEFAWPRRPKQEGREQEQARSTADQGSRLPSACGFIPGDPQRTGREPERTGQGVRRGIEPGQLPRQGAPGVRLHRTGQDRAAAGRGRALLPGHRTRLLRRRRLARLPEVAALGPSRLPAADGVEDAVAALRAGTFDARDGAAT